MGHGSFVTLDFGEVVPAGGPLGPEPRREWVLWVCFAAWRVERGGEVLGGSADERPAMDEAVGALRGRTVTSVEVFAPMLDTTVGFEGDVRLRLFPHGTEADSEHWMLFTPDGNVLGVGPGTEWSYGSAHEPRKVRGGPS